MCSARDNAALPTLGFPIRASAGHWLFSASPRLIAAVHALHRLLVPRHPPCALTILTGDRGSRGATSIGSLLRKLPGRVLADVIQKPFSETPGTNAVRKEMTAPAETSDEISDVDKTRKEVLSPVSLATV